MNCPYCQGEGEIQNRYGPGYVQCRYCGGDGEIWPSNGMTCIDTCTDPQCAGCEKLPSEKFETEPQFFRLSSNTAEYCDQCGHLQPRGCRAPCDVCGYREEC